MGGGINRPKNKIKKVLDNNPHLCYNVDTTKRKREVIKMTEYEIMKGAFIRTEGVERVQVFEWEDGTSALGVDFGGDGGYFEFDENGKLCYCTHNC